MKHQNLIRRRASKFSPISYNPLAWWDISDLSTLFQNTSGTIPITALNQPIGKIIDKSSTASHLTSSNPSLTTYNTASGSGSKPLLIANNGYLSTLKTFSTIESHLFMVVRSISGGVMGRASGFQEYLYNPSGNTVLVGLNSGRGGTTVGLNNAAIWNNSLSLITFSITPSKTTTVAVNRNSVNFINTTTNIGTNTYTANIVFNATHSMGADLGNNHFGEILFYPILTNSQKTDIENYLINKWSI